VPSPGGWAGTSSSTGASRTAGGRLIRPDSTNSTLATFADGFPRRRGGRGEHVRGCMTLASVICLLFAVQASAQPFLNGRPRAPASRVSGLRSPLVPEPRRDGHETESETIAKCLRDYAGTDVTVRRRAILILGKYADPRAQQALVRALADEDAAVRRSALVSLSEKPASLIAARTPLMRLLGDPDVHIRRIASSQLKTVLGGGLLGMVGGPPLRGRRSSLPPSPEDVALLNSALVDGDATVRKNVLALHPYVRTSFDRAAVEGCLRDPDREVRVIAVQAYAALLQPEKDGPGALVDLVQDPDTIVRREVVRALGTHGTAASSLLLRLAQDADPAVRCEAVKLLARIENPNAFTLLKRLLADPAVSVDERRGLIRYMYRFPEEAQSVLLALGRDGPVTLRAEAVQVLGGLRDSTVSVTEFVRLANDESSSVRRSSMMVLQRRIKELTPEVVRGLMESRFVDVRRSALALLAVFPTEQAAELVVDGLLDEDVKTRLAAIRLAHLKRIPDWQQLLADSLQDESVEIRRAAADGLLRTVDVESRRVVAEFLKRNEDPELSAYMRLQLVRFRGAVRPPPNSATTRALVPTPSRVIPNAVTPGRVSPPRTVPSAQPPSPAPDQRVTPVRPRFPYNRRSKSRYRRPTYTSPRKATPPATPSLPNPGQTPKP